MLIRLPLLLLLSFPIYAMEPLVEEEMSSIYGQEGVIFDVDFQNNVNDSGDPINCAGNLNPCRFGLEFADREGIWLMFKEFYGTLRIAGMRVDVDFLPEDWTGFEDVDRFKDTSGGCLIESCDPRGRTALKITYPENKGVGVYDDLRTFFNIGRTALEFDSGPTPGYDRDVASGSFLGYRLSDSSGANAEARARFVGTGYVFGF